MNVVFALAGAVAIAAIVLEYGFHDPVVSLSLLHAIEAGIVAIFVLDRFVRLLFAPNRREYFRENIVDFSLIGLAVVVMAISYQTVLRAGALYIVITQAYILISLILRGVSLNLLFAGSGIHPGLLLLGSFVFMVLAGSGLLMLPVAVRPEYAANWYYVDSLFTSTSATCVTGLVVRNTGGHFTIFGQAVILVLIQCGGLGIMLFGTVLGLLVGRGLTLRQSDTIGQMISSEGIGKLARVAVFVIVITGILELIGAIALFPMYKGNLDTFGQPLSTANAVWASVFHSVSSFCNAGFALYDNNMMHGVREGWQGTLRSNWQVMGVMAPLIVLGGLGFPVLHDCGRFIASRWQRLVRRIRQPKVILSTEPLKHRLSLHSKVILTTSLVLIVVGAVVLLAVEPHRSPDDARIGHHRIGGFTEAGDWISMPWPQRIREATFQSITARTAGFNTIDMSELSNGGKLWMCMLMNIGGSPASTAGGMKTATLALLVLMAWSQLRRRKEVEAFQRSIALPVLGRAVTVAVLYLGLLATVTLLLCVAQGPGHSFIDLLFEASSACGTVGLSTGVTGTLNVFGKGIIIAGMFIGRLGPLTLLAAITSRMQVAEYAYPSENIIIG